MYLHYQVLILKQLHMITAVLEQLAKKLKPFNSKK